MIEEAKHQHFLEIVQKKFFCASFDLPASALAAKLWLINHKLPTEDKIARATLKADVQIIATAVVHGATTFYSNDKKARKLAEVAKLKGLDLPERHPDMHVDAELRKQYSQQSAEDAKK